MPACLVPPSSEVSGPPGTFLLQRRVGSYLAKRPRSSRSVGVTLEAQSANTPSRAKPGAQRQPGGRRPGRPALEPHPPSGLAFLPLPGPRGSDGGAALAPSSASCSPGLLLPRPRRPRGTRSRPQERGSALPRAGAPLGFSA